MTPLDYLITVLVTMLAFTSVMLGLPIMCYLCSKMVAAGWFRGRHLAGRWNRDKRGERRERKQDECEAT